MNQSTGENTEQSIQEVPQNPNQIVNTLNRQFQELEQKVFEIQINQILEQIMTINNQLLLQKQFLDHFLTFLQIQQSQVLFQDVTNYQQCIQIIDANYLQKKQEFEAEFYQRMKVYDELTQKVNLNELEKIMKILKSKQKSIYISKDIQECSCHIHLLLDHKHQDHEHNFSDENNLQKEEQVDPNLLKENIEDQEIPNNKEIYDVQENKENQEIQEISDQKNSEHNEPDQQQIQNEQNTQQNQDHINFQSIEDEQQLLYQQTQELFDQYNHIQSQRQQLAEQKQKAEQALQKQRQMEQKIIELQKRQQQLIQELKSESIENEVQEEQQNSLQEAEVELKEQQNYQDHQQEKKDNQLKQKVEQINNQDQKIDQQDNQIVGDDLQDSQNQKDQPVEENLQNQQNQEDQQHQQDHQEVPNQEQQVSEIELREQIIQSRQQIEILIQQRNDLIQMKEQLSQKQQDLELQKQLLLEKLEVSQNQANEQSQPATSEQVVKETQTEQDSKLQNISFLDIFNVMQFKNLDSLQRYNDKNKSIVFKLHQNYTVEIKGDDIEPDKPLNQDSLLVQIPPFILTHQILQYLSAFEIFKTRSVCGWWRDQIKQIWPAVFKREMYEQMSSNNLKKSIFRSSLLLKLKYKFVERLNNILRAMFELVNWDELNNQLIYAQMNDQNNDELREQSIQIKKCVVSILILLNKIQNIQYLYQIDESVVIEQNAQDLKQLLMDFLSFDQFSPLSISQMRAINLSLLQSPEFELSNVQPAENKNLLYLTIITNQIYYYGLLKNIIKAESFSIDKQSKEFNILSERLNYNSNFLEGAHKIIMRTPTDSNDEDEEGELDGQQEEEKPLAEAQQFLKSLVNLEQTGEPDIVIKKHKTITRIFIDVNTKLDILVSSMHQSKE